MTSCTCQKWHPDTGCTEGRDVDDQGNPIEIVDCQHYYQPLITCAHCGHAGPDVEIAWGHVGGEIQLVPIAECVNRIACWQRWEQNQLAQIRR